jgi:mucin-2
MCKNFNEKSQLCGDYFSPPPPSSTSDSKPTSTVAPALTGTTGTTTGTTTTKTTPTTKTDSGSTSTGTTSASPSTSTPTHQNTAALQTLTQQTCPPLPIDANGKCPGIDASTSSTTPATTTIDGTTGTTSTSTTPVTCDKGKHSDASGKCQPDSIPKPANGCPEDYHITDFDDNLCVTKALPQEDRCAPGWHFVDAVSKKECVKDTAPSTPATTTTDGTTGTTSTSASQTGSTTETGGGLDTHIFGGVLSVDQNPAGDLIHHHKSSEAKLSRDILLALYI